MYKFHSGFFAFCVLLLLVVLSSSPASGQEIVISETTWNGIKLSYAQLKTAHGFLQDSLETSQSTVLDLKKNLAMQWLQLNTARNSAASLRAQLLTAQTQATLLEEQLILSGDSLSKAIKKMRREKGKAYLIGGAVGLAVGAVAVGLIAGLAN